MTGSAAIVGGGVGGLALATYLDRHGWRVNVFERAGELPATGTALGMWPEAMAALDELDVANSIRAIGRRQDHGEIRRADGRIIARIEARGGATYLISRPRLLEALASGPPDSVLKLGATISGAHELDGYDVIVGADGVNSVVRSAVAGKRADPVMTGVSALIGWTDGDTDTAIETWGEGRLFGITPRDGHRTNWYAAFRHGGDIEDPIALLHDYFGQWHPAVRSTLDRVTADAASSRSQVIRYRVKRMPRLRSYVRDNVALIGDAAHAMPPNLGRGACETLVDAVALGRALVAEGVTDGLARYDRERRRTTQRIITGSRVAGALSMATHCTGLRDATVRVVSRFA